ncbi:MAG: hypothetical protein WC567_03870 [Kiritimatiellia bacterium]|jgi:hypothetical protein
MNIKTINHPLNNFGYAIYRGPENEGLRRGDVVELVTSVYQRGRQRFIEGVFKNFRYFDLKPSQLKGINQ